MVVHRRSKPLEIADTQSDRSAPGSAARRVCEANERLAVLAFEQLHNRCEPPLPARCATVTSSIIVAGPQGVPVFVATGMTLPAKV
jgi:hypothetical protein